MFSVIVAPSASVPVIVNTVELLEWSVALLRVTIAPNKLSDELAVLPLVKAVLILAPDPEPPPAVNAISVFKSFVSLALVVVTVPIESRSKPTASSAVVAPITPTSKPSLALSKSPPLPFMVHIVLTTIFHFGKRWVSQMVGL